MGYYFFNHLYNNRFDFAPGGKHFRSGPVPYTRCSRGGRSYFRSIRTNQERRENYAAVRDEDVIDFKVKIRSARCGVLPNAWDDIPAHGHGRGWKTQRRTQYRS